jgi:hypothetical protein
MVTFRLLSSQIPRRSGKTTRGKGTSSVVPTEPESFRALVAEVSFFAPTPWNSQSQRLKPHFPRGLSGTAEAVPFPFHFHAEFLLYLFIRDMTKAKSRRLSRRFALQNRNFNAT